jgi:hypothetical protein
VVVSSARGAGELETAGEVRNGASRPGDPDCSSGGTPGSKDDSDWSGGKLGLVGMVAVRLTFTRLLTVLAATTYDS